MSGQLWVVAVPVIVWAGVFAYTVMLDRKLAAVEVGSEADDR
jgi:CcmD family protein